MKNKILLTNDDGINSSGLRIVYDILKDKYDITIIAPDCERSGAGHSFTYNKPLYIKKIENGYTENFYSVTGSPVDCVKIGITTILDQIPEFIISGINSGENSGISSHYSGTIAAAREGSFYNIKSYAFSISEDGVQYCTEYAEKIPTIIELLKKFKTCLFNINFPNCDPLSFKGIKITRQSNAFFKDYYKKEKLYNTDINKRGYLIYGKKFNIENDDEFDSRALLNGWITITPMTSDSTAYNEIFKLKEVEKFFKGNNNE